HHCHHTREFGHNLEGLLRLMVHRVTDEVLSWRAAWDYAKQNKARLKELVGDSLRPASRKRVRSVVDWTKEDLAACLEVPSSHYLKRGYRPETLQHFGVGTCVRFLPDGKKLLGWTIIPILGAPHEQPYG